MSQKRNLDKGFPVGCRVRAVEDICFLNGDEVEAGEIGIVRLISEKYMVVEFECHGLISGIWSIDIEVIPEHCSASN